MINIWKVATICIQKPPPCRKIGQVAAIFTEKYFTETNHLQQGIYFKEDSELYSFRDIDVSQIDKLKNRGQIFTSYIEEYRTSYDLL
jgi:hypothetical protein